MKTEIENELQEQSPFLADLKKRQSKEPFNTPRLYFDTLADKVFEKAKIETTPPITTPQYRNKLSVTNRINDWLSTIFQPRMALSMMALFFVIASCWYALNHERPKRNELTGTVSTEDVHSYIKENIDDFAEEDIVFALAETNSKNSFEKNADIDMQNSQQEESVPQHPKSGLTESELEEYLKNNLDRKDFDSFGTLKND